MQGKRWLPCRKDGRKMKCHFAWCTHTNRDALTFLQALRKRGLGWLGEEEPARK